MKFEMEKVNEYVTWVDVTEKNAKQEKLAIQIAEHNGKLYVNTYCEDSEGECYGCMYNPQVRRSENGKTMVIVEDWVLESNEANLIMLICKCMNLFEAVKGKTATEVKLEKAREYAHNHGIEITFEKPEGYRALQGMATPKGTVVITNRKGIRDKDYTLKLWVY